MIVEIRGKKHAFNVDIIGIYSFNDFKSHCESLNIFKQLPIKMRNEKIKEYYGKLQSNVKPISKPKSRPDIYPDDVQSDGGDIGAEQGTDDGRKDIEGNEDKAKIQKQTLRNKEKKAKH